MNIKPIKSEADYDAALTAIDGLMGAAPDTPESDKLEVLVTLVEAYEAEHWPIEAPDPISAIEHVMEARGLCQKDFGALIGSQPRASGSAQPTAPTHSADDPSPVDRMEPSCRRACTRVRPREQDITYFSIGHGASVPGTRPRPDLRSVLRYSRRRSRG